MAESVRVSEDGSPLFNMRPVTDEILAREKIFLHVADDLLDTDHNFEHIAFLQVLDDLDSVIF